MIGLWRSKALGAAALGAVAAAVLGTGVPSAAAQEFAPAKVEIAFNRYYTYEEIIDLMKRISEAHPDLVRLETIGKSLQGRDLVVAVVTGTGGGPADEKPAMYIDGNIHGNEVQAAEMVLYTLWFLTKEYGKNERLTDLMDRSTFYLHPVVNPDGRVWWFENAADPNMSRHNQRPDDNDNDGLVDEDGPDDLDGDGHITQMWMPDPEGRFERDPHDPRIFRRVRADQKGSWTPLGQEGIDNDGDGRINEDGPFGDDMNRNFPGTWMPEYVQFGAGPYPASSPEISAIVEFIRQRPKIAAAQSYHNSGGMILRGPGARERGGMFPAADLRVYDEIARVGEQLIPYYRYLVIHEDLYTVYGGTVNFTGETLGIISFTNELWTPAKAFQRDVSDPNEEQVWLFRDRLAFGEFFTDFTEVEHPRYGKVLVGGPNRWAARQTPTFMLEEECHRNFAFTMLHADHMPLLSFGRVESRPLGGNLWEVTAEVRNDRLIPTRTAVMRTKRIGPADRFTCEPAGGRVAAGGTLRRFIDQQVSAQAHEPERLLIEGGVGGRDTVVARWLIEAPNGTAVTLRYEAEKARPIETRVVLGDAPRQR